MSRYEADSLYFTADAALNKQDYALARMKLEEALNVDPMHVMSLNALGWLYERKFYEYDKAERCYTTGLKVDSKHPSLNMNYLYLLSALDKFEEFDAHYKNAIEIAGVNTARAHGEYAVTLEKRGMFNEALEMYKKAMNLSVNSEDVTLLEADVKRVEVKLKTNS